MRAVCPVHHGQWLSRVVGGYFNYHAVPGNLPHSTVFGWLSAAYGGKPSSGAASVTGSSGQSTDALPPSTYLNLGMAQSVRLAYC